MRGEANGRLAGNQSLSTSQSPNLEHPCWTSYPEAGVRVREQNLGVKGKKSVLLSARQGVLE